MIRRNAPSAAVSLLLGVALLLGIQPAAATAGPACNATNAICGTLYNAGNCGLGIIGSWGQSYSRILQPGQSSRIYFQDTDGFYVGPGYRAQTWIPGRLSTTARFYGPGNHKISDTFNQNVKCYPG